MKISFQKTLLKTLIVFGIFSLQSFALSSDQVDEEWMVKITTTKNGETITGTGYVVKIGDQSFVRTASHVTLGLEDVSLTSGNGTPLSIAPGKGIANNAGDDHLIAISNKDLKPLGIYNSKMKAFVVDTDTYKTASKSSLKKSVEKNSDPAFYLVPSWTGGTPGAYKVKGKSLLSSDVLESKSRDVLRLAHDNQVGFVDTQIIPGESGSALIKKQTNKETGESLSIIFGHAQSYQRNFEHSSFSAPSEVAVIADAYLEGKRGDISQTTWKRKNGVFYRERKTKNGMIREANFLSLVAGDGTLGNGGDGTLGNGGDGTVVNGGDGTLGNGGDGTVVNGGDGTLGNGGDTTLGNDKTSLELPGFGMIYHDKVTYAFRVTELIDGVLSKTLYYANWNNYLLVEELKKANPNLLVEPITDEISLAKTIQEKFKSSESPEARRCFIDESELAKGYLVLTMAGFKSLRIDISGAKALRDFSPIQQLSRKSEDTKDWTLDLRGLFSIDSSEVEKKSNESFITIKHPKHAHVRLSCKLEKNESATLDTQSVSTTLRNNAKQVESSNSELTHSDSLSL